MSAAGTDSTSPTSRRQAVILDMDGTLASAKWRDQVLSSPATDAEWERLFELSADDPLVAHVAQFARDAALDHVDVVIATGRPERFRELIGRWLDRNNVPYSALLLRADEDRRPTWEVKAELVAEHVMTRWDVRGAIDDDPLVAGAFGELGIPTTLVVDPGLFPSGPRLAVARAYEPPIAPKGLAMQFELHPPVHRQTSAT